VTQSLPLCGVTGMTTSSLTPRSQNDRRHLRRDPLEDRHCPNRPPSAEPCGLELALRERLKELRCLYGISQLAEQHGNSLPELLRGIVRLLPFSWQHPEICQARLTLYHLCYQTEGFQESVWVQTAPIRVRGEKAGLVEVFYLQERSKVAEGPFLEEERHLLDAVAERVGKMVEQFQVEQRLEVERSALKDANSALKQVLTQIEDEKAGIYEVIHANIEKILMPTLRALSSGIPAQQKGYVALLQNQLNETALR